MKLERILYTKPSITKLEIEYAAKAAEHGWGDRCYEFIEEFEKLFSGHIGSKYAIATSSCTGAMHMGLHAAGIKEGDEIILADTNWIATVSPIIHLGAKPILVDIDPLTWCVDPNEVIRKITSKTKAIIATHLYGNLCDLDALQDIADEHGLYLIEDAAEAIGSIYKSKRAGSIGKFSTFSFHGTKTLTTGEGGIFLTDDANLYERVNTLSNHGRSRNSNKQFWAEEYGYKFKISNIQAAIGVAQMNRIDELISKKRYVFEFYQNKLNNIKEVSLNYEIPNTTNGYWMPNLVFDKSLGITREIASQKFHKENIDARIFFWPISSLPMQAGETHQFNKHSYDIASRSINLPSYHDITDDQLQRVINTVLKIIGHG